MSRRRLLPLLFWCWVGLAGPARAHELQPCYLELRQTGPETFDVVWKAPAAGGLSQLLFPRFPAGCAALEGPVAFASGGAWIERATIHRAGGLDGQRFTIQGLETTATDVLVRVERLDGRTQTVRLTPVATGFVVEPPRGWLAVAGTYTLLGIEHILLGVDHLLFVLGLLLIVRGRARLVQAITAFTLAHSLTLAAATLDWARAPHAPLNAAIALSILFLGPEIVRTWRGETSLTIDRPWVVALVFGLLHGFGFATGLTTIGLPRSEVVLGLLWFNVGVEFGQLSFVALFLALAWAFRVLEMSWPAWVARLPGYAVGTCGAYWTIQRTLILLAP